MLLPVLVLGATVVLLIDVYDGDPERQSQHACRLLGRFFVDVRHITCRQVFRVLRYSSSAQVRRTASKSTASSILYGTFTEE